MLSKRKRRIISILSSLFNFYQEKKHEKNQRTGEIMKNKKKSVFQKKKKLNTYFSWTINLLIYLFGKRQIVKNIFFDI